MRKKATISRQDPQRVCLQCGKKISGRSDKTFCCTDCKNEYHNSMSRAEKAEHKKIFASLSANFRILKKCTKERRRSFSIDELKEQGFNPDIFTGCHRSWLGFDEFSCLTASYIQDKDHIFNIICRNSDASGHSAVPSEGPSNRP